MIRRGSRRLSKSRSECRNIAFDQLACRLLELELVPQVVGVESGHAHAEHKFLRIRRAEQPNVDRLVAGIEWRKDEALLSFAGRNGSHAEGVILKEGVHLPIGTPGGKQLDRQEPEHWKKHQRQHAELQDPPAAREMVGGRRFVGRVVIRIDADEIQSIRLGAVIDDSQPHRLNAAPRHRHAEEAAAFDGVEHGERHFDAVATLGFGSFDIAMIIGRRQIGDEQPTQNRNLVNSHRLQSAQLSTARDKLSIAAAMDRGFNFGP